MTWLGNWMWTREHAVLGYVPDNRRSWCPICNSCVVYAEPQHDAAKTNRERGDAPKCRRCLALIAKEGE